jgi:PAS domain S-box-containing protein
MALRGLSGVLALGKGSTRRWNAIVGISLIMAKAVRSHGDSEQEHPVSPLVGDSADGALLAAVGSSAVAGSYRTDVMGTCTWVNAKWQELTGLSFEQAMGAGWQRAIHPDDVDRLMAEWNGLPATGRDFCSEYRYLRPDGTVRWILGRATEEFDSAGKHIGFVGVCVDITELRVGGNRSKAAPIEGVGEPSARELEVARLLASGLSNKQVAKHLCISPRTVEVHRGRLMRKLRIKSLAGLIRYAMERGLVH